MGVLVYSQDLSLSQSRLVHICDCTKVSGLFAGKAERGLSRSLTKEQVQAEDEGKEMQVLQLLLEPLILSWSRFRYR